MEVRCKGSSSCVFDDETNDIMEQIIEADVLVFDTPVYWWGISSQMKIIIDKFYSHTSSLAECSKQVGVIVVGELPQENPPNMNLFPDSSDASPIILGGTWPSAKPIRLM